jgi:tRNA dimethylallyltransferase
MLCKQIIIAITGPTASGKTGIGIQLAKILERAEVISVDSRQVYRHMDIGTAKPTVREREGVPHHFIDVKDPDQVYSAGDFGKEARKKIEQLWREDAVPLLIGGSGLYLQAVLEGLFADEPDLEGIRQAILRRMEEKGLGALWEDLERENPVARMGLSPNDVPRIVRALEMAYKRGKGDGAFLEGDGPFECLPLTFCLEMDRLRLYQRINQRADEMVERGLQKEVEGLVEMGYGRGCPGMGTLGYAEILDFLDGLCGFGDAVELIKSRSRKYAKRQLTWFRRDRRLRWLDTDRWGEKGVVERVLAQYQAEKTVT